MRLSSIVVIVLRLFAVYWAAAFLINFVGVLALTGFSLREGETIWETLSLLSPMLPSAIYLLLAILAWVFSGKLARRVTKDVDGEIAMSEIRTENLYAFGILLVGLSSFLTHLGGSLSWLYYLAVNQAGDALLKEEEGLSLYDVASQFIPCAAGLYFAILSPKFGRRLAGLNPGPGQTENQDESD